MEMQKDNTSHIIKMNYLADGVNIEADGIFSFLGLPFFCLVIRGAWATVYSSGGSPGA